MDVMSVTVTLKIATMVKETTEQCCVIILHLLPTSSLPTKLLKSQVKKPVNFLIVA